MVGTRVIKKSSPASSIQINLVLCTLFSVDGGGGCRGSFIKWIRVQVKSRDLEIITIQLQIKETENEFGI